MCRAQETSSVKASTMENKDNAFVINVNSPGNFIAREINFTGTVHIGGNQEEGGYTDEQVAQAITAINGKGKPLNTKRKWAAVHWGLRWYCNYPPGAKEFCERIEALHLGPLEYECDYNSIRRVALLSFMDQNARFMDKVKPNKQDTAFFQECREVVLALVAELGKTALSKIAI